MGGLYVETIKYFSLALDKYIPEIDKLADKEDSQSIKEELDGLLSMYIDIKEKIDQYKLNCEEPYRKCENEPDEIDLRIGEKVIENLAMLTKRMLNDWKLRYEKLNDEDKIYITKKESEEKYKLKRRIENLEVFFKNDSFLLYKYNNQGASKFPNEKIRPIKKATKAFGEQKESKIFPNELLIKLPTDIKDLCEDFNFNMQNKRPKASMLILRNILPTAIVRKFQIMNKESEILINGEYLDTKALLGKIENYLKERRIYSELLAYKPLIDSSQHLYSIKIWNHDSEGAAIKIRLLLEQIYN